MSSRPYVYSLCSYFPVLQYLSTYLFSSMNKPIIVSPHNALSYRVCKSLDVMILSWWGFVIVLLSNFSLCLLIHDKKRSKHCYSSYIMGWTKALFEEAMVIWKPIIALSPCLYSCVIHKFGKDLFNTSKSLPLYLGMVNSFHYSSFEKFLHVTYIKTLK